MDPFSPKVWASNTPRFAPKVNSGIHFQTSGPPSPEATFDVFLADRGGPKSEEASIWSNFDQKSGPATHRDWLKKCFFEQMLRHLGPPPGGNLRGVAGRKGGPTTKDQIWRGSFHSMKRALFEKVVLAL